MLLRWLLTNLHRFLGAMMSNIDYLRYLIYMFADFIFNDATIIGNRVEIYNDNNEVCLSIYVEGFNPDYTTFVRGNVKQSAEAVIVMNCFIDTLRMIFHTHDNPADVIKRLVCVNERVLQTTANSY